MTPSTSPLKDVVIVGTPDLIFPESAITITSIRHTGGTLSGSAISTNEDANTSTTRTDITASTTYLNGSSVTGDYGTLTIGADGSYTYLANSANELDDGDIGTDIFTYTPLTGVVGSHRI